MKSEDKENIIEYFSDSWSICLWNDLFCLNPAVQCHLATEVTVELLQLDHQLTFQKIMPILAGYADTSFEQESLLVLSVRGIYQTCHRLTCIDTDGTPLGRFG